MIASSRRQPRSRLPAPACEPVRVLDRDELEQAALGLGDQLAQWRHDAGRRASPRAAAGWQPAPPRATASQDAASEFEHLLQLFQLTYRISVSSYHVTAYSVLEQAPVRAGVPRPVDPRRARPSRATVDGSATPVLDRRAPLDGRRGELRARGADRPARRRHRAPAGRVRRDAAPQPSAAPRRRAVPDARGAASRRIDLGIGRSEGRPTTRSCAPSRGRRTPSTAPASTSSSISCSRSAASRRCPPTTRWPASGPAPRRAVPSGLHARLQPQLGRAPPPAAGSATDSPPTPTPTWPPRRCGSTAAQFVPARPATARRDPRAQGDRRRGRRARPALALPWYLSHGSATGPVSRAADERRGGARPSLDRGRAGRPS